MEKICKMSIKELQEKQKLAVDLYNEANGFVDFTSVQINHSEIEQKMERCGEGPDVILIDLNESKSSKEFIFLVFDCQKQLILETI